jgi:hypothetical protein
MPNMVLNEFLYRFTADITIRKVAFTIESMIMFNMIRKIVVITKGPFIYYVSTFCFINRNIFTNFLSIFLYVLKISNYSMKILSKCNVEKEILLFWQKKRVFLKNLEVNLSFVLYKCLRNIWMVPKALVTMFTLKWFFQSRYFSCSGRIFCKCHRLIYHFFLTNWLTVEFCTSWTSLY